LKNLPETRELTALATERAQVDGAHRDARIQVDDLTREQRKADTDVEQVKTRRTRDQDRMDRGLVTSAKDLEHMSQELVSLARRISELEDLELEVMERLETVQGESDRLTERLRTIDERVGELTASRDAAAAEVRRQLDDSAAERKVTASGVPEPLLTLYEKVRAQKGGVGAAALVRHRCTGCSLELTAADLGDIARAPLDEVQRCVECNRILVRTSESGI
jgi:predicted  nucleic acid-binding Zn-ribbon protein